MTDNSEFANAGSIHGRFQPFHNGHLEYLQGALARCDYLYVGVTQFRRRQLVQVSSTSAVHRALPESNPLSYFERLTILQALFASLGIDASRYCVVPFPIEEPQELSDFLPTSVRVFTTTYDSWNKAKIELLRSYGYEVENLWSRDAKLISGQQVRDLLRADDAGWRDLVPPAVADVLAQFEIGERLRALALRGGR
jgi:cytidyltransferase-like protein